MYKLSVLLIILPALVFGQTPVRQCSSGGDNRPNRVYFGRGNHDDPDTLRSTHCTNPPCQLSRAQSSGSTLVEFTSNVDTATILPFIRARAFGIWVTQEPPREVLDNPCAILAPEGHSCPLVANENYSYVLTIPILNTTPMITTETEISLRDAAGNNIFCYAVENQIVA